MIFILEDVKNYVINLQSPIVSYQCTKIGCNKTGKWRPTPTKEIVEAAV
jgi:hypothetical protein